MSATLERPPLAPASPPALGRELALVGALTLVAALVRFATLHVQSLWVDEGFTHAIATGSLGDLWSAVRSTESSPPLSYALEWAWVRVWGDGEVGLRSLPALAGTLTVPVLYAPARILAPARVAALAAGLAALAPFLVWYSQEARGYALLGLLGVGAFACFGLALRAPTRGRLAGWAALSALALATHYFGVFPALVEGAWLLAAVRPRRRALLALAVPGAVALALAPLIAYQRAHVPRPWTAVYGPYDQLAATVQEFALGHLWTPLLHRPGFAAAAVVAAAALVLLVRRGGRAERRLALVAGTVAAGTVLLPLALSLTGPTYLAPRNVLVAAPLALLVLAAGLGAPRAGRLGLALAAALAALFVAIDVAVPLTPALQREPWRDATAALGSTPDARVVLVGDGFLQTPVTRAYLPAARRARGPVVRVREVDVLVDPRITSAPLTTPPAAGFALVARRELRRLALARWRAPAPLPVDLRPTRAAGGDALLLPAGG